MSIAVAIKDSAELAESARAEANSADRSMTGQIEHWAKLGRAAEAILPAQVASALKRSSGDLQAIEDESIRRKVLEALAAFQVQSPDALRQKIGIDQQTLFEPDPENPEGIIRITPDGTKTRGVMDGRTFVPKN
ncbi:MAG: hypothetical protein ABI600_14875 [Luteolibacter sp.]